MPTHTTELVQVLLAFFSNVELREVVLETGGHDLNSLLPHHTVPPIEFTRAAVDALRRHGLISAEFFDILRRHRPHLRTEISAFQSRLPGIDAPEPLDVQYLICQDVAVWQRLNRGNLSDVPVLSPRLRDTAVQAYHHRLLNARSPRSPRPPERFWPSVEAYLHEFPNAQRLPPDEHRFPGYRARRTSPAHELAAHADRFSAPNRNLIRALLEEGVLPALLSTSLLEALDEDRCGGSNYPPSMPFGETVVLRQVYPVYLALRSATSQPFTPAALRVRLEAPRNHNLRTASTPQGTSHDIPLVSRALSPSETLLVPVATILPPLGARPGIYGVIQSLGTNSRHYAGLRRKIFSDEERKHCHWVGPALSPVSLILNSGQEWPIRPLDLTRTYTINTMWGMGSCPHLFFEREELCYRGVLFAGCAGKTVEAMVPIPAGVSAVWLAELEEEITNIEGIWFGHRRLFGSFTLKTGERIRVPVPGPGELRIRGKYRPEERARAGEWWERQERVVAMMEILRQGR